MNTLYASDNRKCPVQLRRDVLFILEKGRREGGEVNLIYEK